MGNRTPHSRLVSGRRVVALAAALALTALAGCTTPAPSASPGGSGSPTAALSAKTLTIAAYPELITLDPTAQAPAASAQAQLFNVYETLLKINSEGVPQPLLAQRWEVSPDGRTYTFYLNPTAKFASGKQVTAEAVAQNIDRVRTGGSVGGKAVTAPDGTPVPVGAKYTTWMKPVESATAVDATTLKVTLTRPSNTWLYAMGDTPGLIADPDGFGTLASASAGSGPYQVKEWRKGDSLVLERNPGYWGTLGRFDTVTFKYISDPNAMNSALLAGTIDIIANEQAPDSLVQFADTSRFTVVEGSTNAEVTMSMNNASPALKDVRVRRAIAMAIDKKKVLTDVQGGRGVVIGSMAVPTDPYYEDLSGVNAYNPEQAKALLKEAGATDLTLRFRPANLPYATAAATDITAMLKAVGITVVLEPQPWPNWVQQVFVGKDYDLTIVAHVEARDLNTYDNSQFPTYYWGYASPTFNKLWLDADQAPREQYPDLMKKAARQLADDAPSVWLYMMPNLVVTKATVTGVGQNQTTDSFDVTTIATR